MWQFTEQYKRVERWHARLKAICRKVPKDIGDDEDIQGRDDILAFFQNCYHLKDWVENDGSCQIADKKNVVENFIKNSEFLKVCKDVCNASKHLEVGHQRIDPSEIVNYEFFISGPSFSNGVVTKRNFKIREQYEALDLADKCMGEWHDFFNKQGMSWS